MLRLQIKEKQQQLRRLVTEIEDLKSMVKIIQIERDQSSDEELSKHYDQAMESPEKKEPSLDITLGMLTGPNMFIRIQLCPSEFKPYFLDCMLDSGCHANLEKCSTLPSFYWENTTGCGTAIEGTPVPFAAKAEKFLIKLNKTSDAVNWYTKIETTLFSS